MAKKLPITVISGFASAGKTSVLVDLLRERSKTEAPAVIMNDISEMVSGATAVKLALGNAEKHLLELPNGCICCTLKDIFLQTVREIANTTIDHLYIEANATAEPSLIAGFIEESGLAEYVEIKQTVTVIDASTCMEDFLSTEQLRDRGLVALHHDDRLISEVLTEQIEHADTIIITKNDLVSDANLVLLEATLSSLNPSARIQCSGSTGNTTADTVDTFSFSADRPFHPQRLHDALKRDSFQSVLRARGTAWIATRQDYKVYWSQTGSMCSLEPDGPWWNTGHCNEEELLNKQWFEECGGRFQYIEFIGKDMDTGQLKKTLEQCLLTDTEMALEPNLWLYFDDPFEEWNNVSDRSLFVVRETM